MTSNTDEEEPAPAQPELPESAGPPADSTARRFRWRSKKVVIPGIFALVSVVFALGAVGLYFVSSPGQLTAPSFATIQVTSSFPIAELRYDVSPSQSSPSVTDITVFAQLPDNVLNTPAKASPAVLYLELPAGLTFAACPRGRCRHYAADDSWVWSQPLNFDLMNQDPTINSGVAEATFPVESRDFGYSADDTNASAAIPAAFYRGPESTPPELYTDYTDVGAPGAYDWSGLQPESISGHGIVWAEAVANGDAPGEVAVGVNDANQAQDTYKIFIAGALLGLAGGALLVALQEGLHANDDD